MTRERNAIGVGIGPYNQVETPVQSITTRDEKGDVNKKTEGVSMMPPLMVVTKKNASVLRKILRFFRKNYCAEIIGGKKKIPAKYPALIIDDEADQASINTRASYDDQGNILDDYNPTTINGLIRELLNIFECRSYPLSFFPRGNPYWYLPKETSRYQIGGIAHRYCPQRCIERQYYWCGDLRLGRMHQSPASRSDIAQSFAVRLSVQRSLPEILSDS